jgi:hypothetical protein
VLTPHATQLTCIPILAAPQQGTHTALHNPQVARAYHACGAPSLPICSSCSTPCGWCSTTPHLYVRHMAVLDAARRAVSGAGTKRCDNSAPHIKLRQRQGVKLRHCTVQRTTAAEYLSNPAQCRTVLQQRYNSSPAQFARQQITYPRSSKNCVKQAMMKPKVWVNPKMQPMRPTV